MRLALLLASFALTVYAGIRLLADDWFGVALWFVGAAVLHDLVLFPLYSALDRAVVRKSNYVRVPAYLSGLLLIVFFPLVFRLSPGYESASLRSADGYLFNWLGLTGALFALSALLYAVRARRSATNRRPPDPHSHPGS
ncbi:hypothetical protein SRB5_56490 [Streptomyces sp. RB5]|uniref:Uncharacterized protein n=1 Tax=Streptomyces smaragdinus TaxID=2585196 RepID=A0A7K0CPQ6_9ACTN|nr:hypothetical protein [Streptomyces smaragdinus]